MKHCLIFCFAFFLTLPASAAHPVRKGSVCCSGYGVESVVVTDGIHTTTTDANGQFSLPASADARFIYISTPTEYASPVEEHVVKFFQPVRDEHRTYDFTLTRKTDDETRHGFIVTADPQIFDRKEFELLAIAAKDIRTTVNDAEIPFHGICVGDIISGDHSFYPQYNEIMATAGIDWHNCMGNHDMKIWGRSYETSLAPFETMYGPCYYSFNIGKIHYIVLNDNFFVGCDWYYIGYLEERQLRWLERDLSYIPAGSTVVVALHIPTMYKGKDTQPFDYGMAEKSLCNYQGLYDLLEPYNTHIVSGHMHTTTNSDIRKGLYEHNIAAVSGAWWQGNICTDGTPAGYGVFEANGDRITWYYKSTGYSRDYQLKLYDGRNDVSFSGQIVANVWNCDPAWRIELQVDSNPPVAMTPCRRIDPESRALYADTSKLTHKWITVIPADHYYTAPLPNGAKHVEVTATDRFGNTYRTEKDL